MKRQMNSRTAAVVGGGLECPSADMVQVFRSHKTGLNESLRSSIVSVRLVPCLLCRGQGVGHVAVDASWEDEG